MSLNRIMDYQELLNGKRNNFLTKELNYDLLKDIEPFISKGNVYTEFSEKHNVRYFGELIERYEQRNLATNTKDLRTLIFFAGVGLVDVNQVNFNTNQADLFVESAIKRLKENFDLISADYLILMLAKYIKKEDSEYLLKEILSSIKNNVDLTFEKQIFSIYALLNDMTIYKMRQEYILEVTNLLCSHIKPSKLFNLEDYGVYIMLLKMIEDLQLTKDSKLFKDKTTLKFYKALVSLVKKEYKPDNAKNTLVTLDMEFCELAFYNYKLSSFDTFLGMQTKVTSNGFIRLASHLISFLEKDELCPQIIDESIYSTISTLTYKYQRWDYNCPQEHAIDELFSMTDYKISRVNFDLFVRLTKIYNTNFVYDFFNSERFKYLISEEYKDLFNQISKNNKVNLLNKVISKSEDLEETKWIYNSFIGKEENKIALEDLYNISIIKLLNFDIIDSDSEEILLKNRVFECALEFWLKNLDTSEYVEKLKYAYDNIEKLSNNLSYSVDRTSNLLKNLYNSMYNSISNCNIKSIEDKELCRELYKLKDNLCLGIYSNRNDYYKSIVDNLSNTHYLHVFNISQEEKLDILKSIFKNVSCYVNYIEESNIDNYSFKYIKEFFKSLEEMVLTEDEKNLIIETKEKAKEKEILSNAENSRYFNHFKEVSNSVKSKSTLIKLKELLINKISNNDINLEYHLSDLFITLKHFAKSEILNDNEILEISKKIMES